MLIETYDPQATETFAIYQQAKAEQWNPDTDIDWKREHVYEEFVDADVGQIFNRAFVSQMFYGEQGALDITASLVPEMGDVESKLCLAIQVVDESRHMEVFGRYCRDLGGLWPMNDHLRDMLHDMATADTQLERIIGMHVFVEGIALGAFRTKLKQTSDPILQDILRLVARDEARHMEFGALYVQQHLPALTPAERDHTENKMVQWWSLWEQSMRYRDDVVWPTVPKLARRLFNRQTTNNLGEARVDLQMRLKSLGLRLNVD